jgi:hypothetical protein
VTDTGIVDQQARWTESRLRSLRRGLNLAFIRHVYLRRDCASAGSGQFSSCCGGTVSIEIPYGDGITRTGQTLSDGSADPPRRAGNNCQRHLYVFRFIRHNVIQFSLALMFKINKIREPLNFRAPTSGSPVTFGMNYSAAIAVFASK